VRRTGHKLLKYDRSFGARLVAGTDEAGRGPLAGPLVVAGVLLDLDCLREHRARPFTYLNDSKQLTREQRERLFHAVVSCAEKVVVRAVPADEIDRRGLHRSNLDGLRAMLEALTPPRRPASSTVSASGRPRRNTSRSSTATRRARRSRPPR